MTCGDCGTSLDEVPTGTLCPECGGDRRNATVRLEPAVVVARVGGAHASGSVTIRAQTVSAATMMDSVTVAIGYNVRRPWAQKWREVLQLVSELDGMYQPPPVGNEPVYRTVENLFKCCRELADWLEKDASCPEAMVHVNTHPDLRICDGVAQTTKHHTRQGKKDPITARVANIWGGPQGSHVLIEWSTPNGGPIGSEDALDLAQRCVRAWEAFFTVHGLDPVA